MQQDQGMKRKQHQWGTLVVLGDCIILIVMLFTKQQLSEMLVFTLQLILVGILFVTYVKGLYSLAGQKYVASLRTQPEGKDD